MKSIAKKFMVSLAALSIMMGSFAPASEAANRYYDRYHHSYRDNSFSREHPYLKKGLIGGGAGAVIGGLIASDGNRVNGAVKGGLLGAAVGMGYEYMRRN